MTKLSQTKKLPKPNNEINKCDGCTLCCYLLEIPSIKKRAYKLCPDCSLNKGCKIYQSRPQACVNFKCAYYQMDKVSKDLRPDNCKVVFEKVSNTIFFGTQDPRFSITDIAKKQIQSFNQQGFSVIINLLGKKDIYLAPNHNAQQIKQEFNIFLANNHGRT